MVSREGGRFCDRKPAMCRTAPENTGKTGTCNSHALCNSVLCSL